MNLTSFAAVKDLTAQQFQSAEILSEYYGLFERKDLFQIINQCNNLQSSYLVLDNIGTSEYNVITH